MYLPTTMEEVRKLGWNTLDIILVSGDTYIDSSYNGSAVIGKWLSHHGFKVGIIAQPNIEDDSDILRLGIPNLFWGVSSGCVDSMVANYTATKKPRRSDDFTPGGENNKRPDRAVIAYTNLIKRYTKNNKKKVVIGGIEASLRRITHYDYWSNKLRKSILFNSKADILSYGMGENSMLELAIALKNGDDYKKIRGLSYISNEVPKGYIEITSHSECLEDKYKFIEAFTIFYKNCDSKTAKGLAQKQDTRYIIQNPPSLNLSESEMDEVYGLSYERDVHPYYKKDGSVRALDTIKNSVTSHRGCYGECNFCAIAIHQGRTLSKRSKDSIVEEVREITRLDGFKGYISDIGGPTANMYGKECPKKLKLGACKDKRCLYPTVCKTLPLDHSEQIDLLEELRKIDDIKKIFIASGIRYDLILSDESYGDEYLKTLIKNHISGQMKIAPEHTEDKVLASMGKQGKALLKEFKDKFYEINQTLDKKQFLTYYLIAGHPSCNESDMMDLKKFASKELKLNPEQVQIFTPTPSTYSTLMYYTGIDPFTGKEIFVERDMGKKKKQKDLVVEEVGSWKGSKKSKDSRGKSNTNKRNTSKFKGKKGTKVNKGRGKDR